MTQLLIDIAALMPSDTPIPGINLPATGAACACVPGQNALFADALSVLLGQSGQPGSAESTTDLIGGLPAQTLPSEDPIQWFAAKTSDTESELETGIKSDNPKQQDSGDLSQFLFQTVAASESPTPKLTITLADESTDSELTELTASDAVPSQSANSTITSNALVNPAPAEPVPPETGTSTTDIEFASIEPSNGQSAIREQAIQETVPELGSTVSVKARAPHQEAKPVEANAESEPIQTNSVTPELAPVSVAAQQPAPKAVVVPEQVSTQESSVPIVQVDSHATMEVETSAIDVKSNRGEAQPQSNPLTQNPSSTTAPNAQMNAAVESLAHTVNQINDAEVPLKIQITPGQFAKTAHANAETAQAQPVNTEVAAPTAKTLENTGPETSKVPVQSTAQPETAPEVKTASPSQQARPAYDVHKVQQVQQPVHSSEAQVTAPNDAVKSVPLVATAAESVAPKATKTRTPIQPIDEFVTKQATDSKQASKSDLTVNARVNPDAVVSKPFAVPQTIIDTASEDAVPVVLKSAAKSGDSLKAPARANDDAQVQPTRTNTTSANGSQPQTTHAASSASHTQATNHAEQTDAPPPVRFEVEVPKPLRVPGQIRVHLDPPELGQVRIDLASRGDGVIGTLRFQSEQARHIVEREIGQLQKTLQDAGVRVERLEVLGTSPTNSRTSLHTNMNNQQSWSQNTTSQNAFTGGARGHAGMPSREGAPKESAPSSIITNISAYPTMHAGTVNLVA